MATPLFIGAKEVPSLWYVFYEQTVCKVLKFTHIYVFSMRTVLFLSEIYASG